MIFRKTFYLLIICIFSFGCKEGSKQNEEIPPATQKALDKLYNFDFESINCDDIIAVEKYMSTEKIKTLTDGQKTLKEGSIIVYKTGLKGWGKMLLLENNTNLRVKIVTYNSLGADGPKSDNFTFFLDENYDLDKLHNTIKDRDMVYTSGFVTERVIAFINNSKYYSVRKNL